MHDVDYSTLVFPNPANSSEVNIKILGRDPAPTHYAVFNLLGKNVQQGKIDNLSSDIIQLSLNNKLVNGTYVIRMMNKEGREVVVEEVNLRR
ncbi:MAG: T9SS type A sorting domain-containing protein [Saprospiraceae bacterium]